MAELQSAAGTQLDPEIAETLLRIVMRPEAEHAGRAEVHAPAPAEPQPDPTSADRVADR